MVNIFPDFIYYILYFLVIFPNDEIAIWQKKKKALVPRKIHKKFVDTKLVYKCPFPPFNISFAFVLCFLLLLFLLCFVLETGFDIESTNPWNLITS